MVKVEEPRVFPRFGLRRPIRRDERRQERDGDVPIGDGVYLQGSRRRSATLESARLASVAGTRSRYVCHGWIKERDESTRVRDFGCENKLEG